MAITSTALNGLLEESLKESPIGETPHFHWHATPVGIAALWQGDEAPNTPPFDDAVKEGLDVGLLKAASASVLGPAALARAKTLFGGSVAACVEIPWKAHFKTSIT